MIAFARTDHARSMFWKNVILTFLYSRGERKVGVFSHCKIPDFLPHAGKLKIKTYIFSTSNTTNISKSLQDQATAVSIPIDFVYLKRDQADFFLIVSCEQIMNVWPEVIYVCQQYGETG